MAVVAFTDYSHAWRPAGVYQANLAAGDIAAPHKLPPAGACISVWPAAGATVGVWRSSSADEYIEADRAAGRLTKANLEGDQVAAGLLSRWRLWADGKVTAFASEGPIESAGITAVLCESTGGAARMEVSQ